MSRPDPAGVYCVRHAAIRPESDATSADAFGSFAEFYPYYLSEHRDPRCRALHYLGSILVIVIAAGAAVSGRWSLLWLLPIVGYGFAWAGHLFFERNKPATFRYPWWSFLGDWVMLKDFLTKIVFKTNN